MIWQNTQPYDEWLCTNGKCPRCGKRWRNQDGDNLCQHCREPRVHMGRFETERQTGKGANRRLNLTTGQVEVVVTSGQHKLDSPPSWLAHENVGIRYNPGSVDG